MFHGIGQIFPVSQGAGIQGQDVTFDRVGYARASRQLLLDCQIREVGNGCGVRPLGPKRSDC
jgi:hypothetical protein